MGRSSLETNFFCCGSFGYLASSVFIFFFGHDTSGLGRYLLYQHIHIYFYFVRAPGVVALGIYVPWKFLSQSSPLLLHTATRQLIMGQVLDEEIRRMEPKASEL